MEDTIFTKIIKGEIPCHKVYEDDSTFAFLDIHPITEGHTLVIPKKRVEFLWDLDDTTYQTLMVATKKIALHLRTTLNVPYVGVKVVGTDVPHVHIHLLPFVTSADYHAHADMSAEPNHAELAVLAEKLSF